MKLLLDQNLAVRLVHDISDLYPESAHIFGLGLGGMSERAIWARTAADGFVLVTKDEDFQRLSVLLGPPPKVIWIRLGNCRTQDVARLLRFRVSEVMAFAGHEVAAILQLG